MKVLQRLLLFNIIHLLLFMHAAAVPQTQWIYARIINNSLDIINGNSNQPITNISLGGTSGVIDQIIIPNSEDGFYAYTTSAGTNTVYAIDITINQIVASSTHATNPDVLAFVPGATPYLCVASSSNNTLTVLKASDLSFVASITLTGIVGPRFMVAEPSPGYDGTSLFISDNGSNNILPVSIASNGSPTLLPIFQVGPVGVSANVGMALSSDGNTLYVVNSNGPVLFKVNVSSTPVVGPSVTIGSGAYQIVISADGKTAYVACTSGTVSVVELSPSFAFTTGITVGSSPFFLALTSDDAYLYVSNNGSNTISVINTSTNHVVDTINVSNSPEGIAITAKPDSGILDTTFGNYGYTLTPISRADSVQALFQSAFFPDTFLAGTTQTFAPSLLVANYNVTTGALNSYQTLLQGVQSQANALATNATNTILAAGLSIQPPTELLLARYTTSPSFGLDLSFGSGGIVTHALGTGTTINSIAVQDFPYFNRIVVGGSSIVNGSSGFMLAAFTPTGGFDTTFGTGGSTFSYLGAASSIASIAAIPNGSFYGAIYDNYIMAVGTVDNKLTIARYTPEGFLDTSFGTNGLVQPHLGGPSTGYSLVIDSSANTVAVGSVTIGGLLQSVVVRCNTNGLDSTFNGTGYVIQPILYNSEFLSVTIQNILGNNNGFIVAGGYAIGALHNQISLARYTPNGTPDIYFGPNSNGISTTSIGTSSIANAIAVVGTNEPYTNGTAIQAGGTSDGTIYLAQFIG